MKKDQILREEEHHRRPRSIGGSSSEANISYLEPDHHRAWHVLVGNMNAFQICDFLNHIQYKPENIKLVCKLVNGSQVSGKGENNSKNKSKISNSWKLLFSKISFTQAIDVINEKFIDHSYELCIVEI